MSIRQVAEAADRARARLHGLVRETPLVFSARLSEQTDCKVWLKLENLQETGSFKLRGAANRMMTASPEQRASGCVTASSGNHGAGVARAMQMLDVDGIVFVPEQTSAAKLAAIRAYGGNVQFFGNDGLDTEMHARQYAEQHGMFYLSPYNDAEVIAGQGSCGVEIVQQLPDVDAAFIAIGGGGLISGVGSVLKRHNPKLQLIGCQPLNSPVMTRSVEAGEILDLSSQVTLSDGTAGGIEADAITFPYVQELVDDFVLVDEAAIAAAVRDIIDFEQQLIEGAAAVAVASLQKKCNEFAGQNVVVLICGGNIGRATLMQVLSDG